MSGAGATGTKTLLKRFEQEQPSVSVPRDGAWIHTTAIVGGGVKDLDGWSGGGPNEHFGVVLVSDQLFTLVLYRLQTFAEVSLGDFHTLLVGSVSFQFLLRKLSQAVLVQGHLHLFLHHQIRSG
jgi:hypothetical protein